MTSTAAQFTGDIPKNYHEGLGPIIFEPYAKDISDRAAKLTPKKVLELAAGTGIVTRVLRDALPRSTNLIASDLNQAMLDVAAEHFGPKDAVAFEVVDAMSIPKTDESFDLVLSQFGVMFMPDKVASYREALRVLQPGGTYLFNAWDSWSGNPWAEVAQTAVEAFFEGEAPAFYKVPFHYHDADQIKADLKAAGFENVTVQRIKKTGNIQDLDLMSYAAVFGNPLADEIRALGSDVTPEQAVDAVKAALTKRFGPSPTTMPISALVVSARKPGPAKKKGLLARLFG